MATGDKTETVRPRDQVNERFDLVEHAALAQTAQLVAEAMTRNLLASPKATAGVATGERWTGSLTANPTSGSDGLFRMDSPVFIGVDANGGLVVKPTGQSLSIAIPAGGSQQQVYAYAFDNPENPQVRRFLPASGPFNEFPAAINTAIRRKVNLFVRAGTLASVVQEDVIGGVTTPLLFLGVATNTGGAVTFTPGTNTLETVTQPSAVPTSNSGITVGGTTTTGSQVSLRELVNAALYVLGNAIWARSNVLTPSAANNFGAYATPVGGADAAFRGLPGYFSVGDGVNTFGDFNTNGFANSKLLLDSIYAAMPASGGYVFLKRGVQLTSWGGLTSTTPAGKHVSFVGDHRATPATAPQLSFSTSESITIGVGGSVSFENLHVRWVDNAVIVTNGPFKAVDCFFEKLSAADTGAALTGTTVADLTLERCTATIGVNAGTVNGMLFRASGTARRVFVRKLNVSISNKECSVFNFADMRDNISFEEINVSDTGSTGLTAGVGFIVANSTDNTTELEVRCRCFKNLVSSTVNVPLLFLGTAGHLSIDGVYASGVGNVAIKATAYSGTGRVAIKNGRVPTMALNGVWPDLNVENIVFTSTTSGTNLTVGDNTGTQDHGFVVISKCKFACINACVILSRSAQLVWIDANEFDGIVDASTSDWACVKITSSATLTFLIDVIKLTRNVIRSFQTGINYTGGNTINHRIFEVDVARCRLMVCSDNQATNIMTGTSGAARLGAYLLDYNSPDRTNTTHSIGPTILVERNHIEGNGVSLFVMRNVNPLVIAVRANLVRTTFPGAVADVTLGSLVNIMPASDLGNTLIHETVFNDNQFLISSLDGAATTLNVDFFKMSSAQTVNLLNVMMQSNVFNLTTGSGTWAFDMVNAWGIQVPFDIHNLCFKHNLGSRNLMAADAGTWFQTRFTGAISHSIPAVAAASALWADNLNIKGVIV